LFFFLKNNIFIVTIKHILDIENTICIKHIWGLNEVSTKLPVFKSLH